MPGVVTGSGPLEHEDEHVSEQGANVISTQVTLSL